MTPSILPHLLIFLFSLLFTTVHAWPPSSPANITITSTPTGDELFSSRHALLLLKDRLTPTGMLDLLKPDITASNAAWHSILAKSDPKAWVPAMTVVKAQIDPRVMNATTFLSWFGSDAGGPHKLIGAHPEHYVEYVTVKDGMTTVTVVESWGSLLTYYTIPEYGGGKKEGFMAALEDFPFQAVGSATLLDGTVIAHIHNSFRNIPLSEHQHRHIDGGIEAVLYVWLPSSVPDDVMQGLRDHQSIEFSNWFRFALDDVVSGEFGLGSSSRAGTGVGILG